MLSSRSQKMPRRSPSVVGTALILAAVDTVIEFRAKNTFGALVKGRARIDLEEIDGECKVKAVDIIEGAALQVVRPGDERETF